MPADRARFRQPAILRFSTDSFMEEFLNLLNNEPARLLEWQATPETWRSPAPTPEPITPLPAFAQSLNRLRLAQVIPATTPEPVALPPATTAGGSLKLYQAAHQRHYLITACLVCRVPGLPDRLLDTGNDERVSFVLRRLRPKVPGPLPSSFDLESCDEYAYTVTPRGQEWQKVEQPATLFPGEEPLPLFGATYLENDGRKRRLLAGVIPVGRREAYMAAPATTLDPANAAVPIDPRHTALLAQVTDPWRSVLLLEATTTARVQASRQAMIDEGLSEAEITALGFSQASIDAKTTAEQKATAAQIQQLSWYLLLDFADYLAKYVPNVWAVVIGAASVGDLGATEATLFNRLNGVSSQGTTLAAALTEIVTYRDDLESTTAPYPPGPNPAVPPWPPLPFSMADVGVLVNPPLGQIALETLVANARPAEPPPDTPPLPLAAQQSGLDLREPGWFVIRCVFERPNCNLPFPPVVSDPTSPFQLAGFFDPEAPARPIRIPLPIDTTVAGLRKFDKNTAFMMSDMLACQMERMGKLTLGDLVLSVLPWPLHKDLPADNQACESGIGMICSFSIPIITICALILLMIIVSLLDLIFRWIPFFIACFPLPKFRGKE